MWSVGLLKADSYEWFGDRCSRASHQSPIHKSHFNFACCVSLASHWAEFLSRILSLLSLAWFIIYAWYLRRLSVAHFDDIFCQQHHCAKSKFCNGEKWKIPRFLSQTLNGKRRFNTMKLNLINYVVGRGGEVYSLQFCIQFIVTLLHALHS